MKGGKEGTFFLSVWDEGVELGWLETIQVRIHFQYPPLLFHSPPFVYFFLSLALFACDPTRQIRWLYKSALHVAVPFIDLSNTRTFSSTPCHAMPPQAMLPCSNPFFFSTLVQYVGARNTPFFGRQNSLGGTIAVERTDRESRGPIDRGMTRGGLNRGWVRSPSKSSKRWRMEGNTEWKMRLDALAGVILFCYTYDDRKDEGWSDGGSTTGRREGKM